MIKKIGRVGKYNIKANIELAKHWIKHDIMTCEIKLSGCIGNALGLHCCHRHPRIWYKYNKFERIELLWDFKQAVRGCPNCHNMINRYEELKEEVFMKLRGPE